MIDQNQDWKGFKINEETCSLMQIWGYQEVASGQPDPELDLRLRIWHCSIWVEDICFLKNSKHSFFPTPL